MNIDMQLLKNSIDAMEHIFYITDTMGTIEYVNPAFEKQTGYTAAEAVGKNARLLQSGEMPGDYYRRLWRTILAGEPWSEVIVNRRKDGTVFYAQQIITSVRNSSGEIVKFSAIQQDITRQELNKKELRRLARDYEQIFNNTQDAIFLIDVNPPNEFHFRRLNASHEELTGMKTEDVAGKTPVAVLGEEIGSSVAANYARCVKAGTSITYEEKLSLPAGVRFWQTRLTPVFEAGEIVQIVGVSSDITRRRKLAQEMDILFRVSPDMFCVASYDGIFLEVSPAWEKRTGWNPAKLRNKNYLDFIHPDDRSETEQVMQTLSRGEVLSSFDNRFRCSDGSWLWISWSSYPVPDEQKVYAVARDIQHRKEMEDRLVNLSTRDPLLGIYNRNKFTELLTHNIQLAYRYGSSMSLIMLDLDHFKKVNDTYGHSAGDAVLKVLTKTVQSCIRDTDHFARWGGEEFLILCTHTDIRGAESLAERIRSSVESRDFPHVSQMTLSAGVTVLRENDDGESVLKRVDDALYEAKESGRNRYMIRS
ncbi:MAG: sensor domain-containing diguanylate cyclase [Fibrobacterota bacterium]